MNKNFENLNKNQLEAVTFPMESVMVMAGAGTGKTTVITSRVLHLILDQHINPDRILAITFTNKAATEMNDRIKKSVGYPLDWIGTFHSICIRILRREFYKLNRKNNFKIIGDDEEALTIIKDIYENNHYDKTIISPKKMLYIIDYLKSNIYDISSLENDYNILNKLEIIGIKQIQMVKTTYINYVKKFEMYNYVDFNDILNFTNFILSNFSDSLEYWSSRFDIILVDEFQDTNDIQYKLLMLLASKNHNIFAVGDEDQSIYTFRGANPKIIHNFLNYENKQIQVVKLEENYRSTQEILNAANTLINKNKNRIIKNLYSKTNNLKPSFFLADSEEEEANFVVRKINSILALNSDVELKDIVILYRSNYLSRPYEQALVSEGYKYNLYGGFKFYQRTEIKDIIAYLNVIDNNDDLSIRRIINIPRRKISDQTVKHILDYSNNNNLSFYDAICEIDKIETLSSAQKQSVHNFINFIDYFKNTKFNSLVDLFDELLNKSQYLSYVESTEPKRLITVSKNLDELRNGIANFENRHLNDATLTNYLQEVMLYTLLDDKKKNENAINLMTVHTAKGLEFKYVFLVGFCDGIFPSIHSIEENNIEEERRLAYVAITRAKKELFITANRTYNFNLKKEKEPSRFLKDIDNINLNIIKNQFVTKSNQDLDWFDSKNKQKIDLDQKYDANSVNDYKVGDKIIHIVFGIGVVIGINNDVLEISFKPPYGVKNIVYNHKSIKRQVI